jgi:hypothetical protein
MSSISFRNSKVVYYGPHVCENCGEMICRSGNEFGASSFTYPSTPIYPNTEWNPHFCNPQDVRDQRGREARTEVLQSFPQAVPLKIGDMFVLSKDGGRLCISPNCNYFDTVLAAWLGAKDRADRNLPTWELDHVPARS